MPSPLETLPLHLANYLCEFIKDDKSSVLCFSLANKFCCAAATPQQFRRLRFTIIHEEKFRRDLQQWTEILTKNDRFRFVRLIALRGFMICDEAQVQAVEARYRAHGSWAAPNRLSCEGDEDHDEHELGLRMFEPERMTPEYKRQQYEALRPFADFLGRIPGLRDLMYYCTHQIPPCVLEALHRHHPRSRLHMGYFRLGSLSQIQPQDIDLHEFSLVNSPCLYSIRAWYHTGIGGGLYSYTGEAIAWMMTRCPSLKCVQLCRYNSFPHDNRTPKQPWQGFFLADSPNKFREAELAPQSGDLQLESLSLSSQVFPHDHDLVQIQTWKDCRSFETLRCLELDSGNDLKKMEGLALLANNGELRSLRELALMRVSEGVPLHPLLLTLPPLEALKLNGGITNDTVEAAFFRHGPTLRKLSLDISQKALALRFSQLSGLPRCQKLEDVLLTIRRDGGEKAEVAIYAALGRLPRLRRLTLKLACWLRPWATPDEELPSVRKTLIDVAVDEALTRAIWQKLTSAGNNTLERLKIQSCWLGLWEDSVTDYGDLVDWVRGHSWLWTRSALRPAHDAVLEVMVPWKEDTRRYLKNEYEGTAPEVWSDLWPRGNAEHWFDDWHSFPLACLEEEAG